MATADKDRRQEERRKGDRRKGERRRADGEGRAERMRKSIEAWRELRNEQRKLARRRRFLGRS